MRILQFGRTGQVATALQASAREPIQLVALSREDCDLENPAAIRAAIQATDCDLVLNTAAFTQVDRAETHADQVFAVNAVAPGVMAEACAARGLPLVHLSTDAVFDGLKDRPYVETDEARPINVYGRSKLAGERAVLAYPRTVVLRVSWVFSRYGRNYVSTMLRLAREREVLRIVADQFGTPTDGEALAVFLIAAAPRWSRAPASDEVFGLFHFANEGETSRFDFAKAAIERDPRSRARLEPTTQAAFAEPAPRPPRSPLDTTKLRRVFGFEPEAWRAAVERTADRLIASDLAV